MKLRTVIKEVAYAVNKPVSQILSPDGFDLIEEDWDVTIILDACRYDMLAESSPSSWNVESRVSPGSESWEFMQETFIGQDLHNTVYITSNPHAEKLPEGIFHSVHNVLDTHWDSDQRTVPPEEMAKVTIDIASDYPDKRILSHWMQPHFPFVGETGEEILHGGLKDSDESLPHIWTSLMLEDKFNGQKVVEAYNENLQLAIPHVKDVLESVVGKCAVTSDHGNLMGETMLPIPFPIYGHPRGLRKRELITVPWVEFDSQERREVRSEQPRESTQLDEDIVEDRLKNLGYR